MKWIATCPAETRDVLVDELTALGVDALVPLHRGVAFEADLASAIVIEGGDVVARILGGMEWSITHGVRVLNMSLGLRGFLDNFLPVTQRLRQRGPLLD